MKEKDKAFMQEIKEVYFSHVMAGKSIDEVTQILKTLPKYEEIKSKHYPV